MMVQAPSTQDQRSINYRSGVEWRLNPNLTHFNNACKHRHTSTYRAMYSSVTSHSCQTPPGKPKDAVKFVQAPIFTKEDVESFVRDLISKKSLLIQKGKVKADKVAQKVATGVEQK
jgi:hypothetical protein